MKKKLGQKYAIIGRDKRESPITERRSPSKPTQPPAKEPKTPEIEPLLMKKLFTPAPIIPGNWKESVKGLVKETIEKQDSSRKRIRDLIPEEKRAMQDLTALSLPDNAVPKSTLLPGPNGLEARTASGPYYNYGLLPSESSIIFSSQSNTNWEEIGTIKEERNEMMRRILSMENANSSQIRKFNIRRMVELFQRTAGDTGSAEVQAVMGIKINDMREHLKLHPKDKSTKRRLEAWVSKQKKMLKYLKRQNIQKYVETCQAIGFDAKSI